jgi:hypothetical protein
MNQSSLFSKFSSILITFGIIILLCNSTSGSLSSYNRPTKTSVVDLYDTAQKYMVEMRDGVKLATFVHLPIDMNGTMPTLLIRTPYNSLIAPVWPGYFYDQAVIENLLFPVVIQDIRGSFLSEGKFNQHANASVDGYDTMQWIADQTWSNGEIVTMGWSSSGMAQFAQPISEPSWLKAQFISVAPANLYDAFFPGGGFRQGLSERWFNDMNKVDYIPVFRQQEIYSDYWENNTLEGKWDRVKAPGVFLGGWYDTFVDGLINGFNGYQTKADPSILGKSTIIMGPWDHFLIGSLTCCNYDEYPANSRDEDADVFIDIASKLLLDETIGSGDTTDYYPVNYYVMGPFVDNARGNYWVRSDDWPETSDLSLFFHEDGLLDFNEPQQEPQSLSYLYDPNDPVPTLGGTHLPDPYGPAELSSIENRDDTLIFETSTLDGDILITGKSYAKLFVGSNATDTDFVVRVSDVYPDGKSVLLHDGIVRMKWRDNNVVPDFMTPGNIYEIDVQLPHTSYIFNEGHKIRVAITSSNYPAFSINKNDGSFVNTTDDLSTALIAHNTIYFDKDYPSQLTLSAVTSEFGDIDMIAPTIQLLSPQNNSTHSGKIEFDVLASDNYGIKIIQLFLDGELMDERASSGILEYDPESVSGALTFTILATDLFGNTAQVSIQVFIEESSTSDGSIFTDSIFFALLTSLVIYKNKKTHKFKKQIK